MIVDLSLSARANIFRSLLDLLSLHHCYLLMPSDIPQSITDGQFEDAEENGTQVSVSDPRQGNNYIDEEALLEWSEDSVEEDEDEIEEQYDDNRVEDEDWEVAEGGVLILSISCCKAEDYAATRFHKAI